MVQQNPQTKLLVNLLKSTKDYTTTLTSHLVISHTALSGLQAYASASSPSTAQAIIGVAEALKAADDAIVRYANEVDKWRERLKEVKRAEDEVAIILRDREILVNRLIKASSKKPTRDSVIHPPSPSSSQISLGTTAQTQQQRLSNAQAELQGCEQTLVQKQRELEQIRSIAIRDGLERRCMALVQLGSSLSEKGTSGVRALQDGYAAVSNVYPVEVDDIFRNLPLRPRSPNGLSDVSLAPSQSASQNGTNETNPTSKPSPSTPIYPPYKLTLPPPHAIRHDISDEGHNIPLSSRIPEEGEGESSTSETGAVRVIENKPFAAESEKRVIRSSAATLQARSSTHLPQLRHNNFLHRSHSSDVGPTPTKSQANELAARASLYRHDSLQSASSLGDVGQHPKPNGGLFGALTGLFKGKPNKARDASPKKSSPPKSHPGKKDWTTRTDKNVALVRAGSLDGGSSSDGLRNMNGLVAVTNPGYQAGLTLRSSPGNEKDLRPNPGRRKLTRAGSTSKVSTQQTLKHKKHVSDFAVDVPSLASPVPRTGTAADAKSSTPSRSGTIRSTMSEPPNRRTRRTSLPASVPKFDVRGINGPVDSGPPKEKGPKPLHLTYTESPTTWVYHPSSPGARPSPGPSSSVPPHATHGTSRHTRSGSKDTKGTSLMTLVEGVASDPQRGETITTVQRSSASKLMLPSDYVKTTGTSSSPVLFHAKAPGSSIPTVAINPPTPKSEAGAEKQLHSISTPFPQTRLPEVRHNPPPRTTSPLRSALRRRSPSPSSGILRESNGSAPPSATPMYSSPIFAPVPVRPSIVTRESEEDISSYETGHEHLSGEDEDDEPDVPTPRADKNPAQTSQVAHLPNGIGGAPSQSPASTDVSGATADAALIPGSSNVVRRKSVRLDVPATPSPTAHSTGFPSSSNRNRRLPRIPDSQSDGKVNGDGRGREWKTRVSETEAAVPDLWANSSEEEADYSRARKLLEKAKKTENAMMADAAALTRGTPRVKKRHSVR